MRDPDVMRGVILAATGAGKTECFLDLIQKTLDSKPQARIMVAHPRIALSQDQQKRFATRLQDYTVEFTSFHSGHQKYHTLIDRKNLSTTRPDELQEILDTTPGHHITFASYASLHKVADWPFDLIICDEAHYLVQVDLRRNLSLFQSKTLFYTGTPVQVAAADESMDNPEVFGEVLSTTPPKDLIAQGFVVQPRLRTINVKNLRKRETYDYPRIIAESFVDQRNLTHDDFNHKMLVSMPRTGEFDNIMQELAEMRRLTELNNLDVYYVTASRAVKNGAPLRDRETLLSDFGQNPNPCVIIHCDTLAEGIDVDGIGGVLLMRGLSMSKAIQTIGRACRPAKQDVLPSGRIRKNRIKTECIITLARVDGQWLTNQTIQEWAEMFRVSGYGNIWDIYEPNAEARKGDREIEEYSDPVFDEIDEIRIVEGAEHAWGELFQDVT